MIDRRQRRTLLIGGISLASLAAFVVAVWIGSWDPLAGFRASESTVASASQTAIASGLNWAPGEVSLPDASPVEMTDAAFYRGQWFAVGSSGVALDEQGQIWISNDRRNWETVPDPPSFTGQIYIRSVTVGPTGIVAVGRQDSWAQAWFSADGRRWQAAPRQEALGDGMAMAVEYQPAGYVAVGYTVDGNGAASAAVWRSRDGLTWQETPTADSFAATSLMSIAFGHGLEVAVGVTTHGASTDSAGTVTPGAWNSLDGRNWSYRELPSEDGGYVRDVIAVADGFLAVGSGPQGPQVWISDAGNDWQLLGPEAFPGASQRGGLTSVVASGDHLFAMGFDADQDVGWGTIWVSDDGLDWRLIASKESLLGIVLNAVSRGPNGLVAVGNARDPALEYVAAAWYSR